MINNRQRKPHGLPTLAMCVLMTALMILGAILMNTLMGHPAHSEAMPGMTSTVSSNSDATIHGYPVAFKAPNHDAASSFTAAATMISGGATDCAGLCAMICSLMGMACLAVLILFAITWLRQRTSRPLFVVSRALAIAPAWARGVIPRSPVSLLALSIIRI